MCPHHLYHHHHLCHLDNWKISIFSPVLYYCPTKSMIKCGNNQSHVSHNLCWLILILQTKILYFVFEYYVGVCISISLHPLAAPSCRSAVSCWYCCFKQHLPTFCVFVSQLFVFVFVFVSV